MSGNTVRAELAVVLVTSDETKVRLVAGFRYCRQDPFAVRIAFQSGSSCAARSCRGRRFAGFCGRADLQVR